MKKSNAARLFLTELMFSIFFFTIVAAICVQLFAYSFDMSKKAKLNTQVVNAASNAAENFLGSDKVSDFTIYYDKEWQECSDYGTYKLTGLVSEEGNLRTMSITVSEMKTESVIYALSVNKAVKEGV
ncbi:MAG: hypothetical protein HUJ98_01760 [Bacteroidaceae bacterium]|nr:hypothetical protein [Bacteroidaceae bacterium]